ncbi:MAG TPA: DUF3617 family protein [Caulobacteraceae bacterium]|jgi:hypothetical protein|nr:DUF3617 family protein [Caulobacteraceae bacterium]
MRALITAGLLGAAAVSLAACNPPGVSSNNAANSADANSTPAAPGATAAAGPLTPDQIPHRRPGLWKQVMSMDGATPQGPGIQLCVDEASEAKLNIAAMQSAQGMHCTQTFARNLDGSIAVSGNCNAGANGVSTTTGTIRGDFNTGYTMDMHTTMTGSPVSQMNGNHTMTITATWTGPCAPGQHGGDMVMPNGQTHNMLDSHPTGAPQ